MVVREIPSPLNRFIDNGELGQAVEQMLDDGDCFIQPDEDQKALSMTI